MSKPDRLLDRIREYLTNHPESEHDRIARQEVFPVLRRWSKSRFGKDISGYDSLGWFLAEQIKFLHRIVYDEFNKFGTWDSDACGVMCRLANTGSGIILECDEEMAECRGGLPIELEEQVSCPTCGKRVFE